MGLKKYSQFMGSDDEFGYDVNVGLMTGLAASGGAFGYDVDTGLMTGLRSLGAVAFGDEPDITAGDLGCACPAAALRG